MKKLFLVFIGFMQLQTFHADFHTIFTHGIVDNSSQIDRFSQAIYTPQVTSINFPDSMKAADWGINGLIGSMCLTILGKNINLANMHMGQGPDIETLRDAIQATPHDEKIILYGCSRGSATIINYLAQHNPTSIQAIVLDACPADIPSSIKPTLAKLGINPDNSNAIFRMLFPGYPTDSVPPIKAIKHIENKQVPILILHSKTDLRVSPLDAYALYIEFKKQGFTNIHLVMLPDGKHSFLLQNDDIKSMYLQAVHTFYKTYNLPYNSEWTENTFDLNGHMPNVQEMAELIISFEENIQTMYQNNLLRNQIMCGSLMAIILATLAMKYYL